MRPPVVDTAYCRLTVLSARVRVDVALPADVPVAELVPMVLELMGEPRPGRRPEPWRLRGAAGGPLPAGATLAELGVLDGELLRIGPEAGAPAPPVFDDPVEALAATAGTAGTMGRRCTAAVTLALATAAALLLAATPDAAALRVVIAALAAAAAVGYAGRLARAASTAADAQGEGTTDALLRGATTVAVAAVPLAAAAGWAALPGASVAAHLLLAAATAGTLAAVAQVVLRVVSPALVGVVVAAVPIGLAALAVLRFGADPAAAAAGVGAVGLAAGPLLPRFALRLAGLPRPVVPADGEELVEADAGPDLLPPHELAERADLARGYLAGFAGGCALPAAVAAIPVAASGGWSGPAFAAVTVAVLALRGRTFADPAPARTLGVAAVVAGLGVAALLARSGPVGAVLAATALLAAAGTVALRLSRTSPVASPVSRRAVDLLEGLLVAASVPLAFTAMGLFGLVRGL